MLQYRKELDGLRTLAVIAVITYHANIQIGGTPLFPGGFLGVDIFFVLSGYLITGILRDKLEKEHFSFADFYLRRAKRIIPVMLLVLLVTSVVAYQVLLPTDLVEYAHSLKSAAYFASNYHFYAEDSYVAAASIYKPLLHTWSLAVEWQFYMLYPVLVWFCYRYFPNRLFIILVACAVLSFAYSQWMVIQDHDFAFYMLPTRAWELIAGGLITFIQREKLFKLCSSTQANIAVLLSLVLMLTGLCFFDHFILHPSYLTLIPVLGTCLFIAFTNESSLISQIFRLRPIVYIGLISYSLYLWHQPLFVFFRIIKHDYFRLEQFILLLVISIVLAALSHKFVEAPFRKSTLSKAKSLILAGTCTAVFSFAFLTLHSEGFPGRNAPVIAKLFHNINALQNFRLDSRKCHDREFHDACEVKGKTTQNYIVIGDSHAGAISKAVFELSQSQRAGFMDLTTATCLGIDSVVLKAKTKAGIETQEKCLNKSKLVSAYIEAPETPRSTIVFLGRLPLYLSGEHFDNQQGGVEHGDATIWLESTTKGTAAQAIIDKLNLWTELGHRLVLIYPVPEVGWSVPQKVKSEIRKHSEVADKLKAFRALDLSTSYELYKERSRVAFSLLDQVAGEQTIRLYPEKILCDTERCYTHTDNELYYYDDDHISAYGAARLIEQISDFIPKE
ncbi:acyltransferase [Vibrio sp. JC009]|uniref:acyltransferase family protein n=1 Tax=Vibrio sp. JC009 TaxID=2912314 RepID=UPI0023B1AEB9|nr:acyltransferase family protein [Vibrio sp. JC009]WED21981.1 acyltransferase [Vibrio sp. JC009]